MFFKRIFNAKKINAAKWKKVKKSLRWLDENQNKILLCVRYGTDANDIIQETMDNPY